MSMTERIVGAIACLILAAINVVVLIRERKYHTHKECRLVNIITSIVLAVLEMELVKKEIFMGVDYQLSNFLFHFFLLNVIFNAFELAREKD